MCRTRDVAKADAAEGAGLVRFSRAKVAARGDLLIVEDKVYDAAAFRSKHPGGAQFVSAFGGRDATMAFQTYHSRRFPHETMKNYLVGVLDDAEEPVEHDEEHLEIAGLVRQALREDGRGQAFAPAFQWIKVAAILVALTALEASFLVTGRRSWFGSAVLGLLYAMVGLNIQHDANHGALSRRGWVNTLVGLAQDYIGGSAVMWIQQHVVLHHIFTNDVHMDPDADGFPAIRFHNGPTQPGVSVIGGRKPLTAAWFPWHLFQHLYIFALEIGYGAVPLLGAVFELLFWRHRGQEKFRLSPLLLPWGLLSLGLHVLFFARFFYFPLLWNEDTALVTLGKLAVTAGTGGGYLAFFFALSHNFEGAGNFEGGKEDGSAVYPVDGAGDTLGAGAPSEADGFVRRQVSSSSNVCGAGLAFLNGGLNYQIEHHLFPRIAHSHYPFVAKVVREWCDKKGIEYVHFPTISANVASMSRRLYALGHPGRPKAE